MRMIVLVFAILAGLVPVWGKPLPAKPVPVLNVALAEPVTSGQTIGKVTAPGAKTFRLAQVIPSTGTTYFAIDNSGNITVTAAGAAGLSALTSNITYTLTVTATNGVGTGTGFVVINFRVGPPVVATATFNITTPVAAGQAVGAVTATGGPTSWAITVGSP